MNDRIKQALAGQLGPAELTGEEQEEFLNRFADKMDEVSPEEAAFWADRERRGLGVGMDDDGNLVYAIPDFGVLLVLPNDEPPES